MEGRREPILEIIACTIEDALAAERGGANRLEVISHYEAGGLTPSFDLVRKITSTVKIPARVMLRESEPFVVSDAGEIERLRDAARAFARLPVDGLVLGFLKEAPGGKQIDHELVSRVLACAPNLKATFHRAFEELPDPIGAIGELKRHPQIDCVLSRGPGRYGEAWAPLDGFVEWEQAARPEIRMLLGGGIDEETIEVFCKNSSIRAFHIGQAVRERKRIDGVVLAERVREMEELIRSQSP
ncbi:MAG TPA: copper homeostasis protein CutC [Blastocatellia bacterium]|jgi:copper homeostasis protein|nr:copper homeostasis protein CutC [Blastocatellia bacterium]